VEEWNSFRFGPDMASSTQNGTIMAEVVHPVDRALEAMEDANGRLVSENADSDIDVAKTKNDRSGGIPLSPESVGHLAQHTFCRILYDTLDNTPNCDILFGRRATGFDWNAKTRRWAVQTDQGELFDDVDVIVAADGAASPIRKNLFPGDDTNTSGGDSKMLGTPTLQRLINVHFTVPQDKASEKKEYESNHKRQASIPPAMLYTVFNPEVLAMCVRHGPGEYVLQIPYFEPYQTPEEDFEIEKVRKMVRSILGNSDHFSIQSIRPWTMGSLVAQNYHTDHGVFLAGDAAHVFPPAGGFGMNTGLQDVYSLAWRIAFNRQRGQNIQEQPSNDHEGSTSFSSLSTLGCMYERERQPIARQNAALSVRNYNRVLSVMRACYLDDRHPALLIKALDATASFVPLEMRRNTFRALLKTALSPLSQLQTSPNGVYARTIKDNLRSLLGSGQGLPLLFPRCELDFSYDESSETKISFNETEDWSHDSVALSPRLAVGALFPHVVASIDLESLQKFPRLHPIDNHQENNNENDRFIINGTIQSSRSISTRDLAAQLATDETPCAFCILEIVSSTTTRADDTLSSLQAPLQGTFGIPFVMSRLIVRSNGNGDETGLGLSNHEVADTTACNMYVDRHQWEFLNLIPGTPERNPRFNTFVVIRPDGHVAAISTEGTHLDNLILGIQTFLKAR